jgi:hypothetical protein
MDKDDFTWRTSLHSFVSIMINLLAMSSQDYTFFQYPQEYCKKGHKMTQISHFPVVSIGCPPTTDLHSYSLTRSGFILPYFTV